MCEIYLNFLHAFNIQLRQWSPCRYLRCHCAYSVVHFQGVAWPLSLFFIWIIYRKGIPKKKKKGFPIKSIALSSSSPPTPTWAQLFWPFQRANALHRSSSKEQVSQPWSHTLGISVLRSLTCALMWQISEERTTSKCYLKLLLILSKLKSKNLKLVSGQLIVWLKKTYPVFYFRVIALQQ